MKIFYNRDVHCGSECRNTRNCGWHSITLNVDHLLNSFQYIHSARLEFGKLTSLGLIGTNADDDIARILGFLLQVILEDLSSTFGISVLRVQSRSRVMGNHAISSAERVLHCPPDVILWSGLDVPYIPSIS